MLSKEKLKSAIRYAFRSTPLPVEDEDEAGASERGAQFEEPGFFAIRALADQINLANVSSVSMGPEKIRSCTT